MAVTTLPRSGYQILRTRSVDDDTDLDLDNATAASQTGGSLATGALKVPDRCVSIQIVMVGTDAENEVANWFLYGYKPRERMQDNQWSPQPPEYLAHGTATLGKQVVDPAGATTVFYADTIAITAEAGVYDLVATTAGANSSGSVAKLICNNPGFEYLYMVMTKNTCASMGAYVTWH